MPRHLWDDARAAQFSGDLGQRIYSSRLLGRDDCLVLHGGGNTSVKIIEKDLFAADVEVLYVKGSGHDLIDIAENGFTPLRCAPAKLLAQLPTLSDAEMVNELASASLKSTAPAASVEAILHAILPFKYVDHTHADAIVTLTNSANGIDLIDEIFGDSVIVVPYIMPGFKLSRRVHELIGQADNPFDGRTGMVLLNHGIFTWGETARESYDRMITLVQKAEDYVNGKTILHWHPGRKGTTTDSSTIANLRKEISRAAGRPMLLRTFDDSRSRHFSSRSDLSTIARTGPATPDHVIRTKRHPMLGTDVDSYVRDYSDYFSRNATPDLQMLDPAPRVILDADLGFSVIGASSNDLRIVEDIYRHTMDIIDRAEDGLGGYRGLSEKDLFDMEYWDLEQAKLKRAGPPRSFAGEVALVTGSASGIGKACARALLDRGAAVVGVDIVPHESYDGAYQPLEADVTDAEQMHRAIDTTVRNFGGLDMLVLSAGVFPSSEPVASASAKSWRKTMSVNVDSAAHLLSVAHPFLCKSPARGRVVIIGSKNVAAPGPGAAAYSASKAALTQLARVAALEWGSDSIRVNMVHPNAVFDTGMWTDDVLASRAKSYDMTLDDYKKSNLLGVEISSRDVGELVAEMCGPLFAKVHGAQIAIDGGNERTV